MKGLLITILTIFTSLTCFSQDWEKRFRKELFESLLNPADCIFVMDRKQLERVAGITCNDKVVKFKSITQNGDKIEINIEKGDFDPSKHHIYLKDTIHEAINGQVSYNELTNGYDFLDGTAKYED